MRSFAPSKLLIVSKFVSPSLRWIVCFVLYAFSPRQTVEQVMVYRGSSAFASDVPDEFHGVSTVSAGTNRDRMFHHAPLDLAA